MDGPRHGPEESQRPRVRDRVPSVHSRHHAAGNASRPHRSAIGDRRNARIRRRVGPEERARRGCCERRRVHRRRRAYRALGSTRGRSGEGGVEATRRAAVFTDDLRTPEARIHERTCIDALHRRRRGRGFIERRAHLRRELPHSLHRARAARATRRGGGVEQRRQADRLGGYPAAVWRALGTRNRVSHSRKSAFASSFPTPVPPTGANTAASMRSRPLGLRRRPGSP